MKIEFANIRWYILLFVIATILPIALQVVAYVVFPGLLWLTFREHVGQIVFTVKAFFLVSLIIVMIGIIRKQLKIILYQPAIYFAIAAVFYPLALFYRASDDISAPYSYIFYWGWSFHMFYFFVFSLPSSIILHVTGLQKFRPPTRGETRSPKKKILRYW